MVGVCSDFVVEIGRLCAMFGFWWRRRAEAAEGDARRAVEVAKVTQWLCDGGCKEKPQGLGLADGWSCAQKLRLARKAGALGVLSMPKSFPLKKETAAVLSPNQERLRRS